MTLVDLSRELHHRTPTLPNHPPVVMTEFGTIRRDGDVTFSVPRHGLHGTANILFKFVPPETLERFGGPEKFGKAVDATIDTLATYVKNPTRIPGLLFGEA